MKFGKLAAEFSDRDLLFKDVLRAVRLPDTYDSDVAIGQPIDNPMFLNDEIGCHSADTEVLTENGWILWPDYTGQERLATMNQYSGLLEYQTPIACIRYDYDGPMAFANHTRLDFALTPNHRMFLAPYKIPYPYVPGESKYGSAMFTTVDNLPHRSLLPGATTGYLGTEIKKIAIGRREWDGVDFVRLLALILSDGYVAGGDTQQSRISFCCFRQDRREIVAFFANRLDIREEKNRQGVWVFNDAELAHWLRSKCYVGDVYHSPFKCIPDLIKVCSQDQIEEFFKFFGDQHKMGNGKGRQFYSSSQQMANDIQELLLKIGKRASLFNTGVRQGGYSKEGKQIQSRHPAFVLHESDVSDVSLLSGSRRNPQVQFDQYKGEVFCATVPNSTLITRRNGRVLISGNCCVIAGRAHQTRRFELKEQKKLLPITDAEVKAEYFRETGGEDSGLIVSRSLRRWRVLGWTAGGGNYKIKAYSRVSLYNRTQVKAAIYSNLGVGIGFAVSQSAIDQFDNGQPWDVASDDGDMLGGHYVYITAYNPVGFTCITWGKRQLMTWPFFDRFTDEIWAVIDASNDSRRKLLLDLSVVDKFLAKIGQ